jgi:uncharacterized protein (UPF0305 family)
VLLAAGLVRYIPRTMSETEKPAPERRSNLVLRALIDEMLEQVRELNRSTSTDDAAERAQAEAQLDAIMARVRRVAATKHAEQKGGEPGGSQPDKSKSDQTT